LSPEFKFVKKDAEDASTGNIFPRFTQYILLDILRILAADLIEISNGEIPIMLCVFV
jgi:hypothetical protein